MALEGFDGLRLELRGQVQERKHVQILARSLALDSLQVARQLHVEDARIDLHVNFELTQNENDYTPCSPRGTPEGQGPNVPHPDKDRSPYNKIPYTCYNN